ncbi:hypothetical protein Bpfe_006008, partial [Biomphalaria pfeifferi]
SVFCVCNAAIQTEPNDIYCERVLEAIDSCDKAGIQFNSRQQKEIGTILKKNLETILDFLFDFAVDFDPTREQSPTRHRSALRVILNDFKHFSTDEEGETLEQSLDTKLQDDDTVSVLEEAVQAWERYNIAEGQSYVKGSIVKTDAIGG